jgi:hypothetical protein
LANVMTGIRMLASLFLYPLSRMVGDGFKLANGTQIYPVVAPALIVVGSRCCATSGKFTGMMQRKRSPLSSQLR